MQLHLVSYLVSYDPQISVHVLPVDGPHVRINTRAVTLNAESAESVESAPIQHTKY